MRRTILLMLALSAHAPLRAQDFRDSIVTPQGVCHVWTISEGGSWPKDAMYNRCALDRVPMPVEGIRLPPTPPAGIGAHGSFGVFVNEDGTVDASRTGAGSVGMDTVFYRQLLETVRRWRFTPGMRGGKPVRSVVPLRVRTTAMRNDTLAARVQWSYRTDALEDTLLGTWIREPDPPPYDEERVDSIYVAVMRRLVAMQVVIPDRSLRHCLVIPGADRSRHERLSAVARRLVYGADGGGPFAPMGCESDTTAVRVVLPKVHRTENDRAVLFPSGDRLLEWPRDLTGQSWKFWEGRCVGLAGGRGAVSMDCDVFTGWREGIIVIDTLAAKPRARPHLVTSDRGPFRMRLIVTSRGAFWSDTLSYEVRGPLPSISASAATDTLPRCNAWQLLSPQEAQGRIVFLGDPHDAFLSASTVQYAATPVVDPPSRSGRSAPGQARLVAFFLGDQGSPPASPVTLRLDECGRSYLLDPARHTLARRAHARFRVGDLREQTRPMTSLFGIQLIMRIELDPALEDVYPLVVIHESAKRWYSPWFADAVSPGVWKFALQYGSGYPLESTLSVYLLKP